MRPAASLVGIGAAAALSAAGSLGGVSAFTSIGGASRTQYSIATTGGVVQRLPLHYAHGGDDIDLSTVPDVEITPEEREFFARTSALCSERNLPLAGVKNARDLATVSKSPVRPGRIYRTGRVSDASDDDIALLFDELGVRTLVDLRSPTELKDDPTLERDAVFKDFVSVVWNERGRGEEGKEVELPRGKPRIRTRVNEDGSPKPKMSRGERAREMLEGMRSDEGESEEEGEDPSAELHSSSAHDRRERHFVSIMNELKYVRGTLSKLKKRDIAKALIQSPPAIVSSRARARVKDVFLSEINGGGLPLLNELLLHYGAPGIRRVLELFADRSRHPIAFYCTAGKDRTGVIAAVLLSALGVPDEDIVEDYSLSANVYAEMNDHKAMVGALSQRNLDAKTFLGAPPEVMRDTLEAIRDNYGSVEGYLDWIGFDEGCRERLRRALLEDDE
mmetsp:Transcript_43939/g.133842  ORF Transcript_43939/g.133842 Transcript_43939/m.133842 type:complete len:447 (-) Transcript_43939:382-1722(-)